MMPSVLVTAIRSGLRRSAFGLGLVAVVVGPLILAGGLSAQTLPLPKLPPEAPPEAPPDTGAPPQTPATTSPSPFETTTSARWHYALGVGVGFDSNIDFRVPDGPSSWALKPRGNVARVVRSRQGELRLGAQANWTGYRSQEVLNRYNADLSIDGSYRTSVRTTWQLGGAYQVGYSDHSRVLGEQGVMLPLVRTRTSVATLGMDRTVGLQTTLHVDGRFYRTDFDQQDIDTYGLREGQSLRGTASLDRQFGLRNSAAIQYSLEAVDKQESQPYLTHFGSLQWNYLLQPRSALLVQVGASYTPNAAEAGLSRQEYFYGGASYSRRVGSSSITLVARREVVPAFGSGFSRIQDRFGLSARIPIRRHWSLLLSGTHRRAETPEGSATDYGDRNEASAVLSRRLGRHFELSGEGRYRHRAATSSQPMIDQFVAGVFLSLVSASGGR